VDSVPASKKRVRPDYGLDAPGVVRNFAIAGVAAIILGIGSSWALQSTQPELADTLLKWGLGPGLSWLAAAGMMTWGSRVGKLWLRDRLLGRLSLRGDERVLDLGCGHGLLLLGAARRLTTGKAIGIDRWIGKDQADNRPEATNQNARLEGVADRVEVISGDARQLPFANGTFDLVLSSWVLHNLATSAEREQAVREIARVLNPGGRVAILDLWYTRLYQRVLDGCGLVDLRRSFFSMCFGFPTFLVVGRNPTPIE
jgi:SAM-dependent methyltransferase